MAESLRGSRLGAVSYENEAGVEPAPRRIVGYVCDHGHHFGIPLSAEAETPATWECPHCGAPAHQPEGVAEAAKAGRRGRTPWDMLMERRTEPQLEELLEERLALLRERGGADAAEHSDHRRSA